MPTMGRYCKAYPLSVLRGFADWSEAAENARLEEREVNGKEVLTRRELTDDSYVFLHESLVVTDGVFLDEHVIFDSRTAAWEAFCRKDLGFTAPEATASADRVETPHAEHENS